MQRQSDWIDYENKKRFNNQILVYNEFHYYIMIAKAVPNAVVRRQVNALLILIIMRILI